MKIIGIRDSEFKRDDGTKLHGYEVWWTETPKENSNIQGMTCGKAWLSDRVLNDSNYIPMIGDEIDVFYNKFGKVTRVFVR